MSINVDGSTTKLPTDSWVSLLDFYGTTCNSMARKKGATRALSPECLNNEIEIGDHSWTALSDTRGSVNRSRTLILGTAFLMWNRLLPLCDAELSRSG
jgi:hypothetical protein